VFFDRGARTVGIRQQSYTLKIGALGFGGAIVIRELKERLIEYVAAALFASLLLMVAVLVVYANGALP